MTDLKILTEDIYQQHIACGNSTCDKKPAKGEKFKKCSKCKIIHYCSVECQKAHWSTHKHCCHTIGSSKDYKQWVALAKLFTINRYSMLLELAKKVSEKYKIPFQKLHFSIIFDTIEGSIHDQRQFLDSMLKAMDNGSLDVAVTLDQKDFEAHVDQVHKDLLAKYKDSFIIRLQKGDTKIDRIMSCDPSVYNRDPDMIAHQLMKGTVRQ